MKRLLWCVLGMVALCATARAEQVQVANLPEDSAKCYLTVFGEPGEAQYEAICDWMQGNAQLRTLKSGCHYNPIGDRVLRDSYHPRELPCVRLQAPDGAVLCEVSGERLPSNPTGLYDALAFRSGPHVSFEAPDAQTPKSNCRNGRCRRVAHAGVTASVECNGPFCRRRQQRQQENVEPVVSVPNDPPAEPLSDAPAYEAPAPLEPPKPHFPVLFLIAGCVAASIAGYAVQWSRNRS